MFNFNFRINLYTGEVGAYHFDKITDGCYYKPNWKMMYKNGRRYTKFKFLKDIVYFHYVYVKTPLRIKSRFDISIEKGYLDSKDRYEKFMAIKFDKDEDIFNYEEDLKFINFMEGLNMVFVFSKTS